MTDLGVFMSTKMKNYKVKVIFKYTDIVHVKAKNEEDAIKAAVLDSEEEYECFYDAIVTEED